jgi:5-methylthioadenosine/S-adenosylhomocysteine deaminase
MGTRLGANALHLGHLTGSLETGKRADMIVVDLSSLHNSPRFRRDHDGIYAQLVYAAKSNDVSDVMVNGKWLMRDRELLTLQPEELLQQAEEYAHLIDAFLIEREQSVLSKLIAIGGAAEEESFEVQAKFRIPDPALVLEAIEGPQIEILYRRNYHEFDTYFTFEDPRQGVVRYREDEFVDDDDRVTQIRYRLTLIGQVREAQFPSDVLLSRSRYLAPAIHSLRFYREYFKPEREFFIEKHRYRWRVLFQGTEFYINLDRVDQPDMGYFLEVKSRTWSRQDAEHKAGVATTLAEALGASAEERMTRDYIEMVMEGDE